MNKKPKIEKIEFELVIAPSCIGHGNELYFSIQDRKIMQTGVFKDNLKLCTFTTGSYFHMKPLPKLLTLVLSKIKTEESYKITESTNFGSYLQITETTCERDILFYPTLSTHIKNFGLPCYLAIEI